MRTMCRILMILGTVGAILGGTAAWAAGCGNTVRGTQRSDVLDGSYDPPTTECNDFIFALGGDDVVHALGGDDRVNGDGENDTLYGDGGDDSLVGGGGDDVIYGGDGNDELNGGSNEDQLFGEAGNDKLFGTAHNDYLDGGEGQNISDGGTNDDVVVGRSQEDSLTGGSGDDFLIIVGNSIAGYQLEGDTGGGNTFDDLLFFARDANPDMVSDITVSGQTYLQLSFDLRTQLPVHVDLAQVPRVEAVATGDGDDHILGTDRSDRPAYFDRFQDSGTPLSVHELFFAAGGNDLIETLEGDDYVDAGAGNDTVKLGSGAHYLVTGPGQDTLQWPLPQLKSTSVSTVVDFAVGDRIQLLGNIAPDAVTVAPTNVTGQDRAVLLTVGGTDKILLYGVRPNDVRVQSFRGGVEIRVTASVPATRAGTPQLLTHGKETPR